MSWQKEESMAQQAAPVDRMLGIGVLASLIAGLIAGISARIVMRIVALTAHIPLQFTVATLNVVFIGFIAGFIYTGCVVALSSSPKIRKYLPGPLWRGLAFGVFLLLIGGHPSVLVPLLPLEDLNLGIPLLNKSMFAALPLISSQGEKCITSCGMITVETI